MYLPTPPTDEQKYLYLEPNKYFYYTPAILSGSLLLAGFLLFTIQKTAFLIFLPIVLLQFLYLFISYYIGLSKTSFDLAHHNVLAKKAASFELNFLPVIDIFLPCCGEDPAVIENTYRYVKKMCEFTIFTTNVWVLDDGKQEIIRELARKYDFNYIVRENNELKKAGNLRNAFKLTKGDFFVIFDADFCPRHDFLEETMGYFQDKNVAIVQTPQFFDVESSQTPIERGAGYVQELFYRLVQCNRDSYMGAICVGTCAVYRRAPLEPYGGTAAIGYSEDLHTGFNITKSGKIVKYIPVNLSKGICPPDLKTFFYQQYRWAMGSTTLALNPDFWKSSLTIHQKMCYVSGFLYYTVTAIGLIITPIPSMIMLTFFPDKILWWNYLFSIPSLFFTTLVYASWCKSNFTIYFPVTRFIQYWSHLFAIFDKLRGNLVPWVTKDTKTTARFDLFRILNLIWFATVAIVIGIGLILNVNQDNWYHFLPLILVTIYNLTLSGVTGVFGYGKLKL